MLYAHSTVPLNRGNARTHLSNTGTPAQDGKKPSKIELPTNAGSYFGWIDTFNYPLNTLVSLSGVEQDAFLFEGMGGALWPGGSFAQAEGAWARSPRPGRFAADYLPIYCQIFLASGASWREGGRYSQYSWFPILKASTFDSQVLVRYTSPRRSTLRPSKCTAI